MGARAAAAPRIWAVGNFAKMSGYRGKDSGVGDEILSGRFFEDISDLVVTRSTSVYSWVCGCVRLKCLSETGKVKNYFIGFLVCIVVALLIGVDPVRKIANEAMNQGTVRGVDTCMSYSNSAALSKEAVRAMCVRTFQKRLYHGDYATGRAGPRGDLRTVSWSGTLQNKISDHVTTWIRISVTLYDADGVRQEFSAETPIWIEPLSEAEFKVEVPNLEPKQIRNIGFCDLDDLAPITCMDWGVTDIMGLSI